MDRHLPPNPYESYNGGDDSDLKEYPDQKAELELNLELEFEQNGDDIYCDDDGFDEFEDTTLEVSAGFVDFNIGSKIDVNDDLINLLCETIWNQVKTENPTRFKLKAKATLVYNITNITGLETIYPDSSGETEVYEDAVEVEFNSKESKIEIVSLEVLPWFETKPVTLADILRLLTTEHVLLYLDGACYEFKNLYKLKKFVFDNNWGNYKVECIFTHTEIKKGSLQETTVSVPAISLKRV